MNFQEFQAAYMKFDQKYGMFEIRDYGPVFKIKSVGYYYSADVATSYTILVTPQGKLSIECLGSTGEYPTSSFTPPNDSIDTLKDRLRQVINKMDHYLVMGHTHAMFVVSPFPDLYTEEPEEGTPFMTVDLNLEGKFREIMRGLSTVDFN